LGTIGRMPDGARRARLLVVDDEPDMLDFIERATRRTYEVVRCGNGEDALTVLAESRFDLMVTDHKMPRLTGLELLDRIGALYPEMTRVLLSGYAELPDVQRAAATGRVHHYVVKPVDSRTLLAGLAHAQSVRAGSAPFADTAG
jgi:response regulator RpfG family c-di-GMP phosphodiesterase